MPNALQAIIGADAGPFEKEMKVLEDIAARTSRNIESQLSRSRMNGGGGITTDPEVSRQRSVEEATRANRTRALRRERAERQAITQEQRNANIASGSIPESWNTAIAQQAKFRQQLNLSRAGILELGHTIRATFDSIASGASPFRVLLQQGPQLAQSLILIGGRFAALAGMIAGAALITVAFGLGINKVVNKFYDVDNAIGETLEKNRQFWHQAINDARAYQTELAKVEAALRKAFDAQSDAENQLGGVLTDNAVKLAKTEDERHKRIVTHNEVEKLDAEKNLNLYKKYQFDRDPEKKILYTQAEIQFAKAQGAVIDENKRHEDAMKPNNQVLRGNVNDLQRVGAYISPHSVTIVDLNKKMEAHLRSINSKLGHRNTATHPHASGRMSAPRF